LWLGETGENCNEWFAAIYPMSIALEIGFNLWPLKKMDCTNSPLSIKIPKNWDKVIDYVKGKPHPGFIEARHIFDEFLENIRFENCEQKLQVSQSALRKPGCTVLGIDFDELPGVGESYQYHQKHEAKSDYRTNTQMEIIYQDSGRERRFVFDSKWDENTLILNQGEFACYTINEVRENQGVWIHFIDQVAGEITVSQGDSVLGNISLNGLAAERSDFVKLVEADYSRIKIEVIEGRIELQKLVF
jgi:hypothetical protein